MKKFLLPLAITTLILSSAQVFAATEPEFGPPPPPPNHGKDFKKFEKQMDLKLKQELNLTDAQLKKAKAIREEGRKQVKPFFDQMRKEKAKLDALVNSKASEVQINAQKEKMKALHLKMRELRIQNFKKFESILTSEQKVKFEAIKKQKREEHKKRMEQFKNRPEGCPPPPPGE